MGHALGSSAADRFGRLWPGFAYLNGHLPVVYLGALGGIQLLLLWLYRARFGLLIPAIGSLLLIILLTIALRDPGRWRLKFALLIGLIAVSTLGPSLVAMAERQQYGLTFESDSMAMDEVAVGRVMHGQAIYGTDWSGTQVDGYAYEYGGIDLHYYAHFPMMVLAAIPVRVAADITRVHFDYRMVVIVFSLIALGAILCFPAQVHDRFLIAVATLMNPAVSLAGWTGHDDICYLAMLLVGIAFLGRGRLLWASLAFGLAAALKPFALLVFPFLLAVVWLAAPAERRPRLLRLVCVSATFLLPVVLSVAPFLIANPDGFIRDIVTFPTEILPMGGLGFTGILVSLHLVSMEARFPLAPFEVAAMAPVMWFGLRAFARRRTVGQFLLGYSATLFAFLFFARFFADNYLAVMVSLILCIPPLTSMAVPSADRETVRRPRSIEQHQAAA